MSVRSFVSFLSFKLTVTLDLDFSTCMGRDHSSPGIAIAADSPVPLYNFAKMTRLLYNHFSEVSIIIASSSATSNTAIRRIFYWYRLLLNYYQSRSLSFTPKHTIHCLVACKLDRNRKSVKLWDTGSFVNISVDIRINYQWSLREIRLRCTGLLTFFGWYSDSAQPWIN